MAENQNPIMLATKTPSPSFHQSPTPTAIPCLNSRAVFADSTNTNSRPGRCGVVFAHLKVPKRAVYLASSARTNPVSSGPGYSTGHTLRTYHSRHHHLPCTPFPGAYKAPPTVSVSLSAACSQNRHQVLGARVQGLELELPDVKSVVPFPCTSLDGDGDVEMLDGACLPFPAGCSPFVAQAPPVPTAAPLPRKRRSAYSSISSQSNHGNKDPKDVSHAETTRKRAKKSRRQIADLWWLGVVHRSIVCGIEARHSVGEPDASDRWLSEPHSFDAMDCMMAERIGHRLVESGSVERRAVPSPLPRISPPTISVPSLGPSPVLEVPTSRAPSLSVPSKPSPDSAPKANIVVAPSNETAVPGFPRPPGQRPPLSPPSLPSAVPASPISSSPPPSHIPHIHLQMPLTPSSSHPHPSATLKRSPSPPPQTAPTFTHAQTLTLTMPQLVASLTLAHRDRSGLRPRGRSWKGKAKPECRIGEKGSIDGCSLPASQADRGGADVDIRGEGMMQRSFKTHARLFSAPERKSPLSRVAYVGS
ncbi:hypothetical protein BS17DRAFT_877442 [Gyrodon lividus]|nr:hypothetical protein BS17DRAFT_877442 [Gyrodon lividus]